MAAHAVAFVEVPSGSRHRYDLAAAVLDRRLRIPLAYPADDGYIEGALGEDDDALDALVPVGGPTVPGCRSRTRVVDVFPIADDKGPDGEITRVPVKSPARMRLSGIRNTPPELRSGVERFFQVDEDLEEKRVETPGPADRGDDERLVAETCEPAARWDT